MINKIDGGRRRFIRVIAGGVSVAPIVLLGVSGPALADELPHLAADDPTGMALGYVEDTAAADSARFPQHSDEQKCSNCQLVQGGDGDEWRPCQLFPGKAVAADGWCSAWVKKV